MAHSAIYLEIICFGLILLFLTFGVFFVSIYLYWVVCIVCLRGEKWSFLADDERPADCVRFKCVQMIPVTRQRVFACFVIVRVLCAYVFCDRECGFCMPSCARLLLADK